MASQRRHHRGVRVHRRRAAAPARRAPRPRRRGRHGRHPGRHAGRGAVPVARRRLPGPPARRLRPTTPTTSPRSTASTSCSSGLPHQASMALAPAARRPRRLRRRPVGGVPAEGRLAVPAVVRLRARPARAARRGRVRPARAPPRGARRRRLVATPGCYVTAATLALAPLLDAGLVERTGLIVDAASGVTGAGRAAKPDNDVLRRRRELQRLRPARPPPHARDRAEPRGAGAVHAAPGADEPGHPGDLLRPPGRRRRRCRRRPCSTRCTRRLRRRAVRRRHRRLARRRRRRSARTPPTSPPATTSAPAPCWPSPPSTTSPRARPAARLQSANVALGLDETLGLPLVGVAP